MGNLLKFDVSGASTLLFFLDFFSVQYMVRVIDATVHKHDIAAFQCLTPFKIDQNENQNRLALLAVM